MNRAMQVKATMRHSTQDVPCGTMTIMSRILIGLVYLYRATLGRFLGGQCRFHPTCSQYAIDAIHKHGPWRGAWRAARRILRCHPWGGSGYDPA